MQMLVMLIKMMEVLEKESKTFKIRNITRAQKKIIEIKKNKRFKSIKRDYDKLKEIKRY